MIYIHFRYKLLIFIHKKTYIFIKYYNSLIVLFISSSQLLLVLADLWLRLKNLVTLLRRFRIEWLNIIQASE